MNELDISQIQFTPRNSFSHSPNLDVFYDCIVVGAGVTGYSSAMYAARLGLKVLVIGECPGGTLATTDIVENYPGFVSINGQMLTQLLENHAMDYDVDFDINIVTKIIKKGALFHVFTGNTFYRGKTVIYSTGSSIKKLGFTEEETLLGKGISYCALCDLTLVKNKTIAIVGGGDSAIKEAILLSSYVKNMYIINNENDIHPEPATMKKFLSKEVQNKVIVYNSTQVSEIFSHEKITGLQLSNQKKINIDWMFIYIGMNARSDIAKELGVKLNEKNEIIIDSKSQTNIKGFFAAGDVTNTEWKQAIIGVSQGVTASFYAYQYLQNE